MGVFPAPSKINDDRLQLLESFYALNFIRNKIQFTNEDINW